MIRGIFCLNSKCKHYFENNCMHILEKDTISVNHDGKCETFESGIHIGYKQEVEDRQQPDKQN